MSTENLLEATISQIRKVYGDGAIMKLGQSKILDIGVISTGSISLDIATGIGGVPRGRIVEIFGAEASGKTTMALHIVAEAQKKNGVCAYIDAEHALDPKYAKVIGVDVGNLLISQPDYGEQALEIADTLVRSGAIDTIVVDSVAALVPKAELEGEMGDSFVGLQARLMSQALRKLTANISKSKTCVVFINQVREKIGGVSFHGLPAYTTPGGLALKFYSSMRIEVKRIEALKSGEDVIGGRIKAKIVKNKLAPPFAEATFEIIFGEGISKSGDLLDMAVNLDIVVQKGSWFVFGEERLGQGRDKVKKMLEENKNLFNKIKEEIMKKIEKPKESKHTQ